MTVDFHCHSTFSDGTLTPTELADLGASFSVLALTDHDTTDGLGEFIFARTPCRRVTGVELSIEPGEGFDTFHLLGLGIDPENAGLKALLRRILDGRDARNVRIVENFRRLGIELVDIGSYAQGEVLARPHYAKWLMDHGYVKSTAEAFDRYLAPGSPVETRCYEERWHPSQEEAFRVIHEAGGLCVMAHPKYWRRIWREAGCDFAAAERGLAELREKGLDGLEALSQANTGEENVAFIRLADRLGYLKSAGSDFHGKTKPTISLGMEVEERFIGPLLERLS